MPEIPTYYASLHVARNAPAEVIRAAYKTLMQKHHPDRHPEDPEAERVVRLLNEAYAVLNDPQQRAMHDAWIAAQKEHRLQAQLEQLRHLPARKGARASSGQRWLWIALVLALAFSLGMALAAALTSAVHTPPVATWRR